MYLYPDRVLLLHYRQDHRKGHQPSRQHYLGLHHALHRLNEIRFGQNLIRNLLVGNAPNRLFGPYRQYRDYLWAVHAVVDSHKWWIYLLGAWQQLHAWLLYCL